jgi:hypothetical protein
MAEKHKHIWSARIVIFIVALFISTVMHFGGQQSVFAQGNSSSSFPKTGKWTVSNSEYTLTLELEKGGGWASLDSEINASRRFVCNEPDVDEKNNIEIYCTDGGSGYTVVLRGELPVLSAPVAGTFDLRDDENYQAAQPDKGENAAVAAKAKQSSNSSISHQASLFPKIGKWEVNSGGYFLELELDEGGAWVGLSLLNSKATFQCTDTEVDNEGNFKTDCRDERGFPYKLRGKFPIIDSDLTGEFDLRDDENYQAAMVEIEKQEAEEKRKDEEKRQVAKAEEQKAEQRKKEEARLAAEAARKQEAEQEAENARLAAELKRKQELESARIASEEEQKRREEEKRNKLAEARNNGKAIEQLLGADGRIAIQTALKLEGLLHDKADGVFGGNTRKALKAYQSKKGTLKTGYLSANEAAELKEIAKSSAEFIAAEEERKLKAAELKKKRDETRKQLAAETKRKRQEEKERKAAEAELKAEEAEIAAEEERVRKEEEAKKIAESKKRRKDMRKRLAAEAREKRKAEKAKKAADAEAKRVAAEEAKRIAKEKAELAAAEERKRKAKLRKKARQELKRKLAVYREAPETKSIFDGDDDDVVFLLNESDRPLNAIRNLKGDVIFEEGKADICHIKKLALGADYKVALHDELEGKGISDFANGFAAKACGDLEKSEADLVVFQRGAFLNSKFEDAEAVLLQLQSLEFSIFYTSSPKAYKAEIAGRAGKADEVQAGVMSGTQKGFGLLILDNKAKGVCAVKTGKQEAHSYLIETVANELPTELLKIVTPFKFGSLDRTFISLKRKKCRFLFANSENLKTVHAALKRDKIASEFHHQWIDEAFAAEATSMSEAESKKLKLEKQEQRLRLIERRSEVVGQKREEVEQKKDAAELKGKEGGAREQVEVTQEHKEGKQSNEAVSQKAHGKNSSVNKVSGKLLIRLVDASNNEFGSACIVKLEAGKASNYFFDDRGLVLKYVEVGRGGNSGAYVLDYPVQLSKAKDGDNYISSIELAYLEKNCDSLESLTVSVPQDVIASGKSYVKNIKFDVRSPNQTMAYSVLLEKKKREEKKQQKIRQAEWKTKDKIREAKERKKELAIIEAKRNRERAKANAARANLNSIGNHGIQCAFNVNCSDKNAVIQAMRYAWGLMAKHDYGLIGARRTQCLQAITRMRRMPAGMWGGGGGSQHDVCNIGLREMAEFGK